MGRVQGVKERVHAPLYDAFLLKDENDVFQTSMTDQRVIRFFVDIQNKTRLETNLQAAGVLPSHNAFEVRALRVVVSNQRFGRQTHNDKDKVGAANLNESEMLADLIYGSVTSLIVGEKVMIEMPTFWFPAGAGVSPGSRVSNHGDPSPEATFRFAEPVAIDPQQNFRVELSFPQGLPGGGSDLAIGKVRGPFRIWVVLDGYLTRDVQ